MKTRIMTETFSALSFGVSLKEVLTNKEDYETQLLTPQLRAPQRALVLKAVALGLSCQSPPSVPRTGEDKALEMNCEAHGSYKPMVLEQWLVKQHFASKAALCVLAPPADSLPKSAGGFNFYRVPHENKSARD